MRFAVHQPNFCPWTGYFSKMAAVDAFVILDDVQFPIGRSYVSRTKILGHDGSAWLSVSTQKNSGALINEIELNQPTQNWKAKHLNLLRERYRKAQFFGELFPMLEELYAREYTLLCQFNMQFIKLLAKLLEINTEIMFSSEMEIKTFSDERIAQIGNKIGASEYCSGLGGNNYQTKQTYSDQGLSLSVLDFKPFESQISNIGFSVIDNIMEVGPGKVRELIDLQKPVMV